MLLILGNFLTFYSLNSPKNKNFKKEKEEKRPGDIILHKRTKTHAHVLYCSWDMVCHGSNCSFLFWTIFCPFTPITAQKMKISQKWKLRLEISPFYTSVPKIMIRWCRVPEIWCVTDRWTDGWTEKKTCRGECPT